MSKRDYTLRSQSTKWHKQAYFGEPFGISAFQERMTEDDAWKQATVSWPSIGSVTPDEAEQFALAIIRAAAIARQWNAETQQEATA